MPAAVSIGSRLSLANEDTAYTAVHELFDDFCTVEDQNSHFAIISLQLKHSNLCKQTQFAHVLLTKSHIAYLKQQISQLGFFLVVVHIACQCAAQLSHALVDVLFCC